MLLHFEVCKKVKMSHFYALKQHFIQLPFIGVLERMQSGYYSQFVTHFVAQMEIITINLKHLKRNYVAKKSRNSEQCFVNS